MYKPAIVKYFSIAITLIIVCLLPFAIFVYLNKEEDINLTKGKAAVTYDSKIDNQMSKIKPIDISKNTETITEHSKLAVQNNIECHLYSDPHRAKGEGVLVQPSAGGAKIYTVNSNGTRFSNSIPFVPRKVLFATRDNGDLLLGLADLRSYAYSWRPIESDAPLHIYHNEHLIYQNDKIWDFDISSDGNTFVVHEPVSNDVSRLVIIRLDEGTQIHHVLHERFTPDNSLSPSYVMRITLDGNQTVFIPNQADSMGNGVYWFYPLDGEKPKRVNVRGYLGAHLTSSSNGYFASSIYYSTDPVIKNVVRISKRQLDSDEGSEKTVWEQTIEMDQYSGYMKVSDNDKWLLLHGDPLIVVSSETGESVLNIPRNITSLELAKRERYERHKDPLSSQSIRIGGASLVGDSLKLHFSKGNSYSCRTLPGDDYDPIKYRNCLKELRLSGQYGRYEKVVDLNSIKDGEFSSYNYEVFWDATCLSIHDDNYQLKVVDDEFVYSKMGS